MNYFGYKRRDQSIATLFLADSVDLAEYVGLFCWVSWLCFQNGWEIWKIIRGHTAGPEQCFFFPEKKKVLHEKIFKILPEKICKCPRKNLKNCPRKKIVPVKKLAKLHPRKKKSVGKKKIKNSTRENAKSTREKIYIYIVRKNTEQHY